MSLEQTATWTAGGEFETRGLKRSNGLRRENACEFAATVGRSAPRDLHAHPPPVRLAVEQEGQGNQPDSPAGKRASRRVGGHMNRAPNNSMQMDGASRRR